jgi:renalase
MNHNMTARNIAVLGAGIAGLACARTLAEAGHGVTLFEKNAAAGGRTASCATPFGSFDAGAQYFTVRDRRFERALAATRVSRERWNAHAVRVLDEYGRVVEAALPSADAHWVGVPAMDTVAAQWAQPLAAAGRIEFGTRVTRIERDALDRRRWQLQTSGANDSVHVYSGFDHVLLAVPHALAGGVLRQSGLAQRFTEQIERVVVRPCWTLMVAFPQAAQPGLPHLGPQWHAAHSAHHRVGWVARESSKPGRSTVERWTVQASPAWSQEHVDDDAARVQSKLLKAFAEVTGIRAEPTHAQVQRWLWAKTEQPLGTSHLWDREAGLGLCGDWCLGNRVEDAFVSGLELALAVHGS